MSFYYEIVGDNYDIIKEEWYFLVLQSILNNLNFVIGDEIHCIDSANGIIFRGIIKHITNTDNIYRIYCGSKWLNKLNNSGVRFSFNGVDPEINKSLNKVTSVKFDCVINTCSVLDEGDFIELYGSNFGKMFVGKIGKISNDKKNKFSVVCYDLLSSLMHIYVRKIYYNIAVEDIIRDLIEEYMPDLKFEYEPTGRTLEKFFVDDYIYNTIKFLATGVGYVINLDNDTLTFKPYGYREIGLTITKNFGQVSEIDRSIRDIVNDIWIFGDIISISTSEEFTADGQTNEFSLTYSISGSVKVSINDEEISASNYTVDKYNAIIKLNNTPASGDIVKIDYDYDKPINIHLKDNESINEYGLKSKKFTVKSVKSFDVARNLARQYIQIFKHPKLTLKIRARIDKFLENMLNVGDVVDVNLPEKNISEKLIIKDIKKKNNYVDFTIGRDDRDIVSWYNDIESRLNELEKIELSKFLFSEYVYEVDDYIVNAISNVVQSINILYTSNNNIFEEIDVSDNNCALLSTTFDIIQEFGKNIGYCGIIDCIMEYMISLNDNIFNIKNCFNFEEIQSIEFNDNNNINVLYIISDNFEEIDVSDNNNINIIYTSNNNSFEEININDSNNINVLYTINNNFEEIDINDNNNISILYTSNNNIFEEIDVSDNNCALLSTTFDIIQVFGKLL